MLEMKVKENSVLNYGDFSSLKAKTDQGVMNNDILESLRKQDAYLKKLANDQKSLQVQEIIKMKNSEAMNMVISDFANLGKQLADFDDEIAQSLSKYENKPKHLVTDSELKQLISQLKSKQTDSAEQPEKVQSIIDDIENELADLDKLLSDL